jgi:hypothetical protein
MRARFLPAIVFSLVLMIGFGSEAKPKTKPKAAGAETTQVKVSGAITEVSCSQDTTPANRTIVFSVKDKKGKSYLCQADSGHPANAEWSYLVKILVANPDSCFSFILEKSKARFPLLNVDSCK